MSSNNVRRLVTKNCTPLHFTQLHFTALIDTSLPHVYTSLPSRLALRIGNGGCIVCESCSFIEGLFFVFPQEKAA